MRSLVEIKGGVFVSASFSTAFFTMSGHAVLRFGTAHLLDPVAAILRAHEDLALSREATELEVRLFLRSALRFQPGRTYRIGPAGVFVCQGSRVITYIDRDNRFRSRRVRGRFQCSRSCRMRGAGRFGRRTRRRRGA